MIIKKDPDIIKAYLEDSSNLKGGFAEEVAFPENIDELSAILKEASSAGMPVTISGGGTTTTGSRVPFGGVVISMEKFNKIGRISAEENSAVAEAGVLVEDFKDACEKKGLFYTCHPTEKTAFLGGTISTNASGARSFKYGPTRRFVRRLKMVLSDGEVFEIRRGERILTKNDSTIELDRGRRIIVPVPDYKMPRVKNSAGYFAKDGMDLIDLFIGQEGTLSAVVEAELGLVNKPARIFSCFVFFDQEADAWNFAGEAARLSKTGGSQVKGKIDALSIEYFDRNALDLLRSKRKDIPPSARSAIFFEQELDSSREDAVMEEWLKIMSAHNASEDRTWIAMTNKEIEEFSGMRHSIPESVNEIIRRRDFPKLSTDIAVPDSRLIEMMDFYMSAFGKENLEHVIFGHIGESHLHVNIIPRSEKELEQGRDICFEFVKKGIELGGTVSAEHGIGKLKHKYLETMYGKTGIAEMVKIKKAFDSSCILGLDNIFPKELLASA